MLTIRNTLAIALLAVAFLLASGSFVGVAAQNEPDGANNQLGVQGQSGELGTANQTGDQGQSGGLGTLSASARVNTARASLQGINLLLGAQNNGVKPSSKLSADLRKRGGNKQLDRKADRVLDARTRR